MPPETPEVPEATPIPEVPPPAPVVSKRRKWPYVLLALIVAGAVISYFVWANHDSKPVPAPAPSHAAAKPASSTPAPTEKPVTVAGWKDYTLSREKLSFQYPPDWQLRDSSTANGDDVTVTGSKGFTVRLQTGAVPAPALGYTPTVIVNRAITFQGQATYADVVDAQNQPDKVGRIYVSTSPTDPFAAVQAKHGGVIRSSTGYGDSGPFIAVTVIQQDPNFTTALKIYTTMHY